MATFDNIFQATVGGDTFQLSDYTVRVEPILKDPYGRVGSTVEISGEGWVEASSPLGFTAALGSAYAGMRRDGRNFAIRGLGGQIEVELLAAACVEGGPWIGFEVLQQKGGSQLVKEFRFKVHAKTYEDWGTAGQYKVRTAERPNGLRTVTVSGENNGPGVGASFLATIQPKFRALYPQKLWVMTHEYETNALQDHLEWSMQFVELLDPLPVSAGGTAVDGEATTRIERDEQMRLVTDVTFDLLVVGDTDDLLKALRAGIQGVILKEGSEVTFHKEQRLRAHFSMLQGGDGNALMNWEQTLEAEGEDPPLIGIEYPGSDPIILFGPSPAHHYVQRGRAIGAGQFVKPPPPIWGQDISEPRKTGFTPLNEVERETVWEYHYLFKNSQTVTAAILAQLARPAAPSFY